MCKTQKDTHNINTHRELWLEPPPSYKQDGIKKRPGSSTNTVVVLSKMFYTLLLGRALLCSRKEAMHWKFRLT